MGHLSFLLRAEIESLGHQFQVRQIIADLWSYTHRDDVIDVSDLPGVRPAHHQGCTATAQQVRILRSKEPKFIANFEISQEIGFDEVGMGRRVGILLQGRVDDMGRILSREARLIEPVDNLLESRVGAAFAQGRQLGRVGKAEQGNLVVCLFFPWCLGGVGGSKGVEFLREGRLGFLLLLLLLRWWLLWLVCLLG